MAMFQPSALNLSSSPAPAIKTQPVKLTYEEICYAARTNALTDFVRQRKYGQLRKTLKETGEGVQVIPVAEEAVDSLVKKNHTRLLKEHSSASWGAFFYQTSIFGLTGVSSIGTAMLVYLGIYHNRLFLPVAPIAAVVTWRLWNVVEEAWEQQRYLDNAAHIREERKGNPMNAVVKRRKKEKERAAASREEADVDVGGAAEML